MSDAFSFIESANTWVVFFSRGIGILFSGVIVFRIILLSFLVFIFWARDIKCLDLIIFLYL